MTEPVTDSTPLTAQRQADGFRFDAPAAPVYAASLDYGVVRRQGQEPFQLRYEALHLVGDGQPLSRAQVADLLRLDNGLPLRLTATPDGPGQLWLQAAAAGRSVKAEVTLRPPGEPRERALTAADDGRTGVPVRPGANWLRVLHQERGPVAGAEGVSLTRTWLVLTFDAAPEADPACVQTLSEAHLARAAWPQSFRGFAAELAVSAGTQEGHGTVTVAADGAVSIKLDNRPARRALQPVLESLMQHRRGGNPSYQATWLDAQSNPAGRAIALHDGFDSVYRIRDRQILQVVRLTDNGWFVTDVLENETSRFGFLPRVWTVTYYDRQQQLQRTATTWVTWTWLGDIFVPAELRRTLTDRDGASVLRAVFSKHRLLD